MMFNFLKLFFVLCSFGFSLSGNAFFEIVEVMPNTTDDKNLEYITLKNTSDIARSLSGYILADKKKEYLFMDDFFIESGERKEFFRPETKLALNNSDEEIYLYNLEGEKIDEVRYDNSVKGEFLTFETISEGGEENIISQEIYISGEIFISDEAIIDNEIDVNNSSIILEVPEIIFSLQRPSYIIESGEDNVHYCDSEKDECKVNFDIRESFSSDFPERDYMCDIDFGIGEIVGQEGKCNPNTITFPQGEFEIIFKIYHEDDETVFSEKTIFIKNIPGIITISSLSQDNVSGDEGEEEKIPQIYISRPEIIVQSGLTGAGRYFYCEKIECKINLNYEKRHKDERCYWNFRYMEQSSETTHTRCNPGYVTVIEGIHDMSLKVYEKSNEKNSKTLRFYIYNQLSPLPLQDTKNSLSQKEKETTVSTLLSEQINQNVKLSINLQGAISKEKTLSGGTLTCNGVEKCYVNLEGVISSPESREGSEKLDSGLTELGYIWKIDNEIFSEKLNPKGIWVEGEGTHEIIFQVGDIQEIFLVKIGTFFPSEGIISSDSFESELEEEGDNPKIKFTQNFLVLKYDGLRISGLAPAGSKVEIYHKGEKVLEGVSDEKGKYRIVSKNFIAGEYIFDTKVISSSGEEVFLEKSGKFELLQEKRIYWFVSKKLSSSSSKSVASVKIPSLILQAVTLDAYSKPEEEKLGIGMNILLIIVISMIAIIGALHLIFIQTISIPKNIFFIYTATFSTRQKVCLLIQ